MKANEDNLAEFMSSRNKQFVIPVYQRNYDWTHVECQQLFYDILEVIQNDYPSHFIGSIVYIHGGLYKNIQEEVTKYTIIDGQQRLTTISLLWLALYRRAKELQEEGMAEEIYETYLINKHVKEDEKCKLKLTKHNSEIFKHLLSPNYQEHFEEHSKLIENFNFFYNHINKENIFNIKRGIRRLFFVNISLDKEKDDPQRIFESLNSTGLDLSQGDLIRNYVLMPLDTRKQEIIFENYWLQIEKLTTDEKKHESNINDFFRHYLTFKNYDVPSKGEVYQTFKGNFPTNRNGVDVVELLKDVKQYARYFNKLINPIQESDKKIREQIIYIKNIEVNVCYPFLLEVYHDYTQSKIDKETFIEVLKLIQSFLWRRFIVALRPKGLNKMFVTLYKKIKNASNSTEYLLLLQIALLKKKKEYRFPNNEEVFLALETRDIYNMKKKRNYFLERLENHNNTEKVLINDKITIEHIFPQKASKKWKEDIGEVEFEKLEKHLHTIANLTLSGNNGALGRKLFSQKRDLPEKGYRDSRLLLNRYLGNIDTWTTVEYKERLQILQNRFKSIWVYPDIVVPDEESQAVNLSEDVDPTGRELEYIVYLGNRTNIKSYIGIYQHVLKSLFSDEKEKFFNGPLQRVLNITCDKSTLTAALALDEVYYCEKTLSSKRIFEKLQSVLTFFEMEDELLIKFKDTVNQEQASLV